MASYVSSAGITRHPFLTYQKPSFIDRQAFVLKSRKFLNYSQIENEVSLPEIIMRDELVSASSNEEVVDQDPNEKVHKQERKEDDEEHVEESVMLLHLLGTRIFAVQREMLGEQVIITKSEPFPGKFQKHLQTRPYHQMVHREHQPSFLAHTQASRNASLSAATAVT